MLWLQYIFLAFFLLYIIALICAKIYSPFWFHQPVHHIYEIYPKLPWVHEPYIKKRSLPRHGIFCNSKQVETVSLYDTNNLSPMILLLQGHYIDNNTHLFHLDAVKFRQILQESFISTFYEDVLTEPRFQPILNKEDAYGLLTSRPICVFFLRYPSRNVQAHLLDFISIHEKYKTKNISRTLIQTHIYNHAQKDPSFSGIYVFKKEVELCKGIVPFVKTNSYTFVLRSTPIKKMPIQYSIKCLNRTNTSLWRSIYTQITQQFSIAVMANLTNSLLWLENERYVIYISTYKIEGVENIHGVYIFEDTHISWENGIQKPHMVRLASSMIFGDSMLDDPGNLMFFRGFLHSLKSLTLDKKKIGILEIPNISHNCFILEKWREKYSLYNSTNVGFYFYNYVFPKSPISPKECFYLV